MGRDNSDENSEQSPNNEADQRQRGNIWAPLNSIPPTQRRIAEAAVLALYFLFEAHNDWSDNHGWALFSGALGTIVVLAIELPLAWWAAI